MMNTFETLSNPLDSDKAETLERLFSAIGSITWPTDDSPWTILGIQEAYDHAWQVRIDEMNLRVIPPCGMIYLKMLSIYDRPDARRKKDTQDINYVLKHYRNVTERDRLRSSGSDSDLMEKCGGDLELATARLAGRDIGSIIADETSKELAEILYKETTSGSRCPIAHTLASHYRGSFQKSREVLKKIIEGLSDMRH